MNRRVHNAMLALASTGLLLMLGLMAAVPAPASTRIQDIAVGPILLRIETPIDRVLPRTLVAAVDALSVDPGTDAVEPAADSPAGPAQRNHTRRARAALALPYFSFAQGLRRNRS